MILDKPGEDGMKNLFILLLIICSVLLLKSEVYSQKQFKVIDSDSLNLEIYTDFSEGAKKYELIINEKRIRNIVELRLRREGIKTIEDSISIKPKLVIVIGSVGNEDIICSNVKIFIQAIVYLIYEKHWWENINSENFYWATIYAKNMLLLSGSQNELLYTHLERVENTLNEFLDVFLNDYYKANPK